MGGYVRRGGKIGARSGAAKIIRAHSAYRSSKDCEGPNCEASLHEGPPEAPRSEEFEKTVVSIVLLLIAIAASYLFGEWSFVQDTSLLMVQVALKNCSPEIQSELSQIAENINLSDSEGEETESDGEETQSDEEEEAKSDEEEEGLDSRQAERLLSATKKRILLHSERCVSATSSVDVVKDKTKWKERYEQMCEEQLGKSNGSVVEQTAVNEDEYIVVTVLVAAYGAHKLPAINCLTDIEKAFSNLEYLDSYLAAVKVFWTPSDGTSKLFEDEMMVEFQQLKQLPGHQEPQSVHEMQGHDEYLPEYGVFVHRPSLPMRRTGRNARRSYSRSSRSSSIVV